MFLIKTRLALTAIFALLVLPNLGARPLWQDEAETALVAKQMVKSNTWLPYAFDGQGPISQDWNYQFKVSPLWRWHPWLQFYVTALSFKLLGISAFSARLPFAVLGIAAYWYFLNFLIKDSEGWRAKGLAAILMLLSAPLLLHLRQARYYALSLLFTLITIDGYIDMTRSFLAKPGDSSKYSLKYIFGSILLFHSFLPGALTLQISFWIHRLRSLLAERQGDSLLKTKQFVNAFLITLPFTLPWAVWLKIGGQNLNFSPELIKQHLIQHYSYIHKFIFPALTLIPLISPGLRKKFFQDDKLVLFSIIIFASLSLYTFNHPYFFRYLVPLIPLFIYIAARLISTAKPIWALVPLLSIIVMAAKMFPKYVWEIAHPYQTANSEIITFLSSLDPQKYQTLAVNYDDFTFRFHTNYRVFGAQQLYNLRGVTREGPPLERPQSVNVETRTSERGRARQDPDSVSNCPEVVIIFPEWGNEEILKTIANNCRLTPTPMEFNYAKLGDDPDPANHRFTQPPLRRLEAFLAPPSPS